MNNITNKLEQLLADNNVVAVIDFDYTITTKNSNSSIGVFTNYLSKKYQEKKKRLDNMTNRFKNRLIYKFIWNSKIRLLKKYNAKEVLNDIDYKNEFKINNDIVKLIKMIEKSNNKIIIYSSGLKEIIVKVLESYNIKYDNIKILANSFNSKGNSIITPYKKKLNIENSTILIGDNDNDLNVINSNYLIKIVEDKPIIIKWGC